VTIVSGSEEAALTLAGVLEGLPGKTDAETTLVFDIGGGSSEYILARGAAAIAEASLRLGGGRPRGTLSVHRPRRLAALSEDVRGDR
jgi:exopolyphosphatase/guanosine-5'-triphosphate,3'-diphosphate pyrophosphatase